MRAKWESLRRDLRCSIDTLTARQNFEKARAERADLRRFADAVSLLDFLNSKAGDLDEKDRFLLVLHWDRREDLDAYLQSDKFSALMGTRILMKNSPLVSIDTVATRNGLESISKVRAAANTDYTEKGGYSGANHMARE